MKKTFILDTNVLLHDVNCLHAFEDNDIIIPMAVIEELDTFKSESDTRGKNARMVSRALDEMRKQGRLNEGVKLAKGGILKIELDKPNMLPQSLAFNKADNSFFHWTLPLNMIRGKNNHFVLFLTNYWIILCHLHPFPPQAGFSFLPFNDVSDTNDPK